MRPDNDKLTISINKQIKDSFKKVCEEEGLRIGKQIELFMQRELKKREEENN